MTSVNIPADRIGSTFARRAPHDPGAQLPVLVRSRRNEQTVGADTAESLSDDEQLWRAMRLGFLIGSPVIFLAIAAVSLLAGTTLLEAGAIGGWSGLTSGWYFGGMAFLPSSH